MQYDDDIPIERIIKECQIENGRLMGSISSSLRRKYGDESVNRVIQRLSKRRQRGNQYQNNQSQQMKDIVESCIHNSKLKDNTQTEFNCL
jgi:hypothetical protein